MADSGGTDSASTDLGSIDSGRAMRLWNDPRYRDLVAQRHRFAMTLAVILAVVYFSFLLLIAFDKAWLAAPVAGGTTSIGIVLGLGMIVFTLVLTGLYIWRANRDFDPLSAMLMREVGE